jgi:hypothetical protein
MAGTNEPREGSLSLETERVVVFKDGHALFIKKASGVADETGTVRTDEVPESAVLGSFWALSEKDDAVLAMSAEWIETVERTEQVTPCLTVKELLRANRGRKVTLELANERQIDGTLVELLELPPESSTAASDARRVGSLAFEPLSSSIPPPRELAPRGGDLVVIASSGADRHAIPVAAVQSVAGSGLVTSMIRVEEKTERTKRLSIDLGEGAARKSVSLRLLYFTPGLRWIPTYRISGELESSARLALQAEILNEAEEIRDSALDLVVGVPNFRFKDVVSPLTLERAMRRALQEAAPSLMTQSTSQLLAQRSGEVRGASSAVDVTGLAPELAAGGEQDLFVYSVPSFSLAKGARGTIGLWQDELPLRHLYTLDVRLVRHGRSGSTAANAGSPTDLGDTSPLRLGRHQVWHQLELSNNGDVPWTTGAALLMRGTLPLGQELLTYTPIGGQALVPVTVAVDVRAAHDEREIERELNAVRVGGYEYTLVRKAAEIELTNYRSDRVRLRVRVSLGGRAEQTSHDGKIVVNEFRGDDWQDQRYTLNQHSDIVWELELEPGASTTLSYVSSFYLR